MDKYLNDKTTKISSRRNRKSEPIISKTIEL